MSAFTGAVFMAILIGMFSILIARQTKLSQDTTLSILYTGAFAGGIIILNYLGQTQELEQWILGNILGLTNTDLTMSFVIGLLAVILLTLFQRPILLTAFQPDVAETLGVPVRVINYAGFALLILVLVTTLQAVGCILAIGLIVTPGATVRLFTNRPRLIFIASGLLGSIGSAMGLLIAYYLGFPAAASIVTTLTIIFLASWCFKALLTLTSKTSKKNHA